MKKIITFVMAIALIASLAMPATSVQARPRIPFAAAAILGAMGGMILSGAGGDEGRVGLARGGLVGPNEDERRRFIKTSIRFSRSFCRIQFLIWYVWYSTQNDNSSNTRPSN